MLDGQRLDVAADADAGRVDEHVEPAVALHVLGHKPGAILLVRDVGRDGERIESHGRLLHTLAACVTRA